MLRKMGNVTFKLKKGVWAVFSTSFNTLYNNTYLLFPLLDVIDVLVKFCTDFDDSVNI